MKLPGGDFRDYDKWAAFFEGRSLSLRRRYDRDAYVGGVLTRAKDSLRRRLKVRFLRLENISDESLRIAVDDGKPGTLHLHHDSMPF